MATSSGCSRTDERRTPPPASASSRHRASARPDRHPGRTARVAGTALAPRRVHDRGESRRPKRRRTRRTLEAGQITQARPTETAKGPPNRWRHDEHGHEDGHAVACAARCRQPRSDPRARRAREQPQGRQRRDPEAPADGVHRRLRLGQELAGVRHDRRGVAAADQRDLQRLRAGLHADAGAARGRRARRADDRDHRRPAADGRRRPLHGRHRHRRQRDAAHPLQPARAAAHRLAQARSPSTSPRSGRAVRSRSNAVPARP